MIDKLNSVESRYNELLERLADPAVQNDPAQYRTHAKALAEIEPMVERFREFKSVLTGISQAKELASDPDMRELAQEELQSLEARREALEQRDQGPARCRSDPNDEKNVVLEIRAGTGGDEAALFAAELFRMYSRYAESNRAGASRCCPPARSGVGGLKEVIALIEGRQVYSRLKYESGVHRVQRVPATEASGRIHTSTATVAVLPEAEEVDVADRPEGHPDRHVLLERPGRPERQHDLLRRPHHPHPDRASSCRSRTRSRRSRTARRR